MFEIQTNASREVELPAELTPVHERRQWLQNAFQKRDEVSDTKERLIQSPAPRQGLVQDRVQWLKQEGEKYSKTVLPDHVRGHRDLQRDPRKRWSEGEALHIHRRSQQQQKAPKEAEARNDDVDENLEFRNAVPVMMMQDRHSFPLSNDHATTRRRQNEFQIRDEPQAFLFPVVNSRGGEYEMTVERFRELVDKEGLYSPSAPSTAQRIVRPISTPQAQLQPQLQKHQTDSGSTNESRPRELVQILSDSPYERQYDRLGTLSPASVNSLPEYAQLNAGAMAKANVEGIVSDDAGDAGHHHRRRRLQKWREHQHKMTNEEQPIGSDYVSFQTPTRKQDPNALMKKDQLEAEMVGTQCLEHCTIL